MIKAAAFLSAVLFAVINPSISQACVSGDLATRTLNFDYAGISSMPVLHQLGLNASCSGRQVESIVLFASGSNDPSYATLIINGRPVGFTRAVDAQAGVYEFRLDPDANTIGASFDPSAAEIRLAGDFHVDHLEAHLVPVVLPWANWGTLLGVFTGVPNHWTTDHFNVPPAQNGPEELQLVARDGNYELKRIKLHFLDGSVESFGPLLIDENTASRIPVNSGCHCKRIARIELTGRAASGCNSSTLEIRGQ